MNAIAKIATDSMITVRKNLNFLNESTPKYWYDNDPFKTRIFDALQMVFPDGERYFIESIRAYRGDITDEKLKQEVKDFIMQEAQHGIAHDKVNQRLIEQGLPIKELLAHSKGELRRMTKTYSKEFNLAITSATEHLTALMAKCFFEQKETLANSDPNMRALFAWHSIEEMEHRAVCFDVMRDVANIPERTRKLAMVYQLIGFPLSTFYYTNKMLEADGFGKLQRLLMFRKGIKELYGKNGIFSYVKEDLLEYFDDDFHPNNQPMIHSYDKWCEVYQKTNDPMLAGQALWEAGYEG